VSQTLAAASTRRASTRPAPGRAPGRPSRPTLRVVRVPLPDRSRAVFAVSCLLLLVGGMVALLLINTALAQGSFRLHDLQGATQQLGDTEQALRQDVDRQGAPERLARRAKALGMVPAGPSAFIRLSDGRVIGVARATGQKRR
jgi:hypothetical protein